MSKMSIFTLPILPYCFFIFYFFLYKENLTTFRHNRHKDKKSIISDCKSISYSMSILKNYRHRIDIYVDFTPILK